MSVKWTCPKCDTTVLGPERPHMRATCRVCLDCSKGQTLLVERRAPSLEKRRAERAAARAERERKAQERQAQKRAQIKAAQARSVAHERWERGFDLDDIVSHVYRELPESFRASCQENTLRARVVEAVGKKHVADPAWVAAVACWVTGPRAATYPTQEDRRRPYEIAEACWNARPAREVTARTQAYRALYPALRAVFAEREPLHRALSVVASLTAFHGSQLTADRALQRLCRARELGAALDIIAEWGGNALLDADPVPGVPSLREAAARLPPDTPVWEEFLVPCPRDLLGIDEAEPRVFTLDKEGKVHDPLSQGGEVYRYTIGVEE